MHASCIQAFGKDFYTGEVRCVTAHHILGYNIIYSISDGALSVSLLVHRLRFLRPFSVRMLTTEGYTYYHVGILKSHCVPSLLYRYELPSIHVAFSARAIFPDRMSCC